MRVVLSIQTCSTVKLPYLPLLLWLFVTSSLHAQTWQPQGFTPGTPVAYDQNGAVRTLVTDRNVYRSSDGGQSWSQQLSATNAPFLGVAFNDFPSLLGDGFRGFRYNETFVFGDVLFLKANLGTSISSTKYTIYSSNDGGQTLVPSFVENEAFANATYGYAHDIYRVSNSTYLARFQSNGVAGNNASVYVTTNQGQTWSLLFRFPENALHFAGQDAANFYFYYQQELLGFDRTTGQQTTSYTAAYDIVGARISGEQRRLVTKGATDTEIRLLSSNDGGASYTTGLRSINGSDVPVREAQVFGNNVFVLAGNFSSQRRVYRGSFNNSTFALAPNPADGDYYYPLKQTRDGALVNRVRGPQDAVPNPFFNDDALAYRKPFYVSTDGWTTTNLAPRVPYSLDALPELQGTYGNYLANYLFNTTDGRDFDVSFRLSSTAFDVRHFDGVSYADSYSDPSTTGYLTKDALTVASNEIDPTQAGNALYSQRAMQQPNGLFTRTLYKSTDGGATWAELAGSYQWGTNHRLLGDPVTGTLYSIRASGGFQDPANTFIVGRSLDEGQSWTYLDQVNIAATTGEDLSYNQFYPIIVYNGYWFVKSDNSIQFSSDGGETFQPLATPFNVAGGQLYRLGDRLVFRTTEEAAYDLSLPAFVGNTPAPSSPGKNVDISLTVDMQPANPAPFTNFTVTYTLTNGGDLTATNVGAQVFVAPFADAIVQGGTSAQYGGAFAGNTAPYSLAPGESGTITYSYFRQDGDPINPWGSAFYFEPDLDSRSGNGSYPVVSEDDEAIFNGPPPACNPDATPPTLIACPADITVPAVGNTATVSLNAPSATDACGPVTVTRTPQSNSFGIGTTAVVYTATDVAGNTTQCTVQVTVQPPSDCNPDNTEPFFQSCPGNIVVPTTGTTATVDWTPPLLFDDCDGGPLPVTRNFNPGDDFPLGTTTVTYVGTDAAGNVATCVFDVTVNVAVDPDCNPDVDAPFFTGPCPADISVATNGPTAAVMWNEPLLFDICDDAILPVTSNFQSGDDFPLGTTTVTYTGSDAAGNTASCSFDVTVTSIAGTGIDLALTLDQPNASPAPFTTYQVVATLSNTGPDAATGIAVRVPQPSGVVYEGGNEFSASQGNFDALGNDEWTIASLGGGESATLTVNYFLLANTTPVVYGQVTAATGNDPDSTPNNGTPPTPNEDDEASTDSSVAPSPSIDIQPGIGELVSPNNNTVSPGETFLYANVLSVSALPPTAPLTPTDILVALYISTDAQLSNDDLLFDSQTIGPFGFTQEVFFGDAFPALPNGDYFFILEVDVDNAVAEQDETNNQSVLPFEVTSTGALPDLSVGIVNPIYIAQEDGVLVDTRIDNFGDIAVPSTVFAYFSLDDVLDNNDILAVDADGDLIELNATFSPAAPNFFNELLPVPAALPGGTRYVFIVADPNNIIAEADESNNIGVGSFINPTGTDPCDDDTTPPTIDNCPSNQTITTTGTSAAYLPPVVTATDDCIGATVSISPNVGNLPLGTTIFTVTVTDLSGNISTCTYEVTVTQVAATGIDLELSLMQTDTDPNQYTAYEVVATLTNTGAQTATGIRVSVPAPPGVVYEGGNEFEAGAGSFDPLGNQEWSIGSLGAGQSATLTVNYFLLQPTTQAVYGEVIAANEDDVDSTPNNGTPPTPNEDDEASTDDGPAGPVCNISATLLSVDCNDEGTPNNPDDDTYSILISVVNPGSQAGWTATNQPASANYGVNRRINIGSINFNPTGSITVVDNANGNCSTTINFVAPASCSGSGNPQPDLRPDDLAILNSPIIAGDVLDYTFTLANVGNADAPGDFNVKAYISNTNLITPNSIQDGIVPTGNYAAGTEVTGIAGATTIPADLAPGTYFLLLVADADDDVVESNEANNLIFDTFTVTGNTTGGNGVDLDLTMSTTNPNPAIYTSAPVTLIVTNSGDQTATGVRVRFRRPAGTVYEGGNEFTVSQGTFGALSNERWNVGSLAPGQSAELTVNYFLLTGNELRPYAQVTAQNEPDLDSTPNNGTPPTPNEDDEVSTVLNAGNTNGNALVMSESRTRLQFDAIYPNPVLDRVNLRFYAPNAQAATLEFYDATGRRVHTQDIAVAKGEQTVTVFVDRHPVGVYHVLLRGESDVIRGRFLHVVQE